MQLEEKPKSERLSALYYDLNALDKAASVLEWDRVVLMPKGGAEARTEHVSRLARMAHELLVSDELGQLVENLVESAEPGSEEAALARVLKRRIDKENKLPLELAVAKTRTGSEAYGAWRVAKANNDFSALRPYLEKVFEINGEMATHLGYQDHIYDPLMDIFEEGQTYASARKMFDELKGPLKEIIESAKAQAVDDGFLDIPAGPEAGDAQEKLRSFAERIAKIIGYDFGRGRLDITTNAFCTNFSRDDVRLTTRPSESVRGVLFSSLHEMGHGLYEQNSPPSWDRTPLGGGASSGVHESQSRTWENIIGRSLPFWKRFYPELRSELPQFQRHSVEEFYRAINRVQPVPIRVGSDELTYNFHILIRFELECEILTGKVQVKDLPEAWNEKYRQYLGITPETDSVGCLQDVHWPKTMIGYFPAYSMGNMMSWQIWDRLQEDIPNTDELMEIGKFAPILDWLTREIYSQAKFYKPNDLLRRVTGSDIQTGPYLRAMRHKYAAS